MNQLTTQRTGMAMKIVCIEDGSRYAIHSASSGKQYEITYAGSGDADPEYVSLWNCSCPAAQHGRDCKHLRFFLASDFVDADRGFDEGDAD